MSEIQTQVAKALLAAGAVGFTPQAPVRFKSGIFSPVYVDNRRLPFAPEAWHQVIDAFQHQIALAQIEFDALAGIETGGIPHSAALGYVMRKPSVFVRKQAKEHGKQKQVEGGEVAGKRVLLIEDLVTTGGSSLTGVEVLRAEGALVEYCLAIVGYGFVQAREAFEQSRVRLLTLTNFDAIAREAVSIGVLSEDDRLAIQDWQRDPFHWGEKYGFA